MFHWSIFTASDATRFVLTVPFHFMAFIVSLPAVLCVLVFGMKAGHHVRNYGLLAILIVVVGFLGYGSELTLDRSTGKATLREFEFFHWSTQTFDLSQVQRVYVATGARSDQLRLELNDGKARTLSFMDQYGGKEEVATKANAFLGTSNEGHEQ